MVEKQLSKFDYESRVTLTPSDVAGLEDFYRESMGIRTDLDRILCLLSAAFDLTEKGEDSMGPPDEDGNRPYTTCNQGAGQIIQTCVYSLKIHEAHLGNAERRLTERVKELLRPRKEEESEE